MFVLLSALATAVLVFLIARSTKRRFLEVHSAHVLVVSAIVMLVLCYLWEVFVVATWLASSWRTGQLQVVSLLVVLPFLLPVVDAAFAYLLSNTYLRRQCRLSSAVPAQDQNLASRLIEQLGLPRVRVYSSDCMQAPFVYGTIGSRRGLVVPRQWNLPTAQKERVILHELSHILNGDTTFITTAGVLVRRAKFMLLLVIPLLLASILRVGTTRLLYHLAVVYLYCWAVFSVLFSVISRKRELLADLTVAQFVGSQTAAEQFNRIAIDELLAAEGARKEKTRQSMWQSLEQRLDDLTLFGKTRGFWKCLKSALSYVFARHPSYGERRAYVLRAHAPNSGATLALPTREVAFWIGCCLGTSVVLVLLGCTVWKKLIATTQGPEMIFKYFLDTMYLLAFPMVGVVSCLFSLPVWSQPPQGHFPLRGVAALLHRQLYFLLAAILSTLSLLWFWLDPLEHAVGVIAIIVTILSVMALSVPVTGVIIGLYHIHSRYDRHFLQDLRTALAAIAIGLIPVLFFLSMGVADIVLDNKARGIGFVTGVLGGLIYFATTARGVVSGSENYITWRLPFSQRVYRGERDRKTYLITGLCFLAAVASVGLVVGLTMYVAVASFIKNMAGWVILLIVGAIVGASFAPLATRRAFGGSPDRRTSIHETCQSLAALHKVPSTALKRDIEVIGRQWEGRFLQTEAAGGAASLTMNEVAEMLSIGDFGQMKWREDTAIIQWLVACENEEGGFGVWPGSRSRLSTTYLALSMLRRFGWLGQINTERHTRWVKGMQGDGGLFHDPLSGRTALADSFFALGSVQLLGGEPEGDAVDPLAESIRSELMRAIRLADVEAVSYSVAALRILGRFETSATLRWFLTRYAFMLPSKNVIYMSSSVRHLIDACALVFDGVSELDSLFPADFAERLADALHAGLRSFAKTRSVGPGL